MAFFDEIEREFCVLEGFLVFEQVEAEFAHLRVFQEETDVPLAAFIQSVPLWNALDGFLEKDVGFLHEFVVSLVILDYAREMVDSRVVDPVDGFCEERMVEAYDLSDPEELLLQFHEVFFFLEGLHFLEDMLIELIHFCYTSDLLTRLTHIGYCLVLLFFLLQALLALLAKHIKVPGIDHLLHLTGLTEALKQIVLP